MSRTTFRALEQQVRELHASDRLEDAAAAAAMLRRVWAASEDAWVRGRRGFIVDVVMIDGVDVVVYETLGLTRRSPTLWVAHARNRNGDVLSVELEATGRRTGPRWALMATTKGVHRAAGVTFADPPAYAQLRPLLFACLRALLLPTAGEHPGAMYGD